MIIQQVNRLLALADLQLGRKSEIERLNQSSLEFLPVPPLPRGSEEYLNPTNPILQSLRTRYDSHPASDHSQWSRDFIRRRVDLSRFRQDSAYVWQAPDSVTDQSYLLTAYYVQLSDKLGVLSHLSEDGMFGAMTFLFNGKLVSRDLLDSVLEITFVVESTRLNRLRVLDIGAGYGRLAHRMVESSLAQVERVLCVDAIPESTFICGHYLSFRNAYPRAESVPLDEIESKLLKAEINLAINVHSFSECTLKSISWWIRLLQASKIRFLLIIPNTGDKLLSKERSGARVDFLPLLQKAGYELVSKRPKFGDATGLNRYGVFPTVYHLFELQHR